MKRSAFSWLAFAALLLWAGVQAAALRRAASPEIQPIAFNHAIHVQGEEMECAECHQAETSVRAGFPSTNDCYKCHRKPQGESPEEPKVRAYRKARKSMPFKAANRNVGHVYFSHRAHVTFAAMSCRECHGDVGSQTQPVRAPRAALHSMAACMDCHKERGASLECLVCHK